MSVEIPEPATYDHVTNQWSPQCPYGDVCSGCDAAGQCSRRTSVRVEESAGERVAQSANADVILWGCTTFGCERGFNGSEEAMPREWRYCPECGGELLEITVVTRAEATRRASGTDASRGSS